MFGKKTASYLSPLMKPYPVFILLGGNLGNPKVTLANAAAMIEKHIGAIQKKSAYYKTKPWGKPDQPDFINQAIKVKTKIPVELVLDAALEIEHALGRTRSEKWGARLIDIDLLYAADLIIHSERLTIPHPGIAERRFVLEPLVEIAPDFIHPVLGKNQRQLLAECIDTLSVKKC